MRKLPVALCGLLLLCAPTFAGEYFMWITNDPNAPCGKKKAVPGSTGWTIRSGSEVAEELSSYFKGDAESSTLVDWFPDGHFAFCGRDERAAVYEAILDAASLPGLRHEDKLRAVVPYVASRQLLDAIDRRLAAPARDRKAQRLLRELRVDAAAAVRRVTLR